MGGGIAASQSRFGVFRKQELTEKAITRTTTVLGVNKWLIPKHHYTIKIVNEKQWAELGSGPHVLAFWTETENTIYIRRKYFAGLKTKTLIHEQLHTRSGPMTYTKNNSPGRRLEEGTVEYLAQTVQEFGFKTKGKIFAKSGFGTYPSQVEDVSALMHIVGRSRVLFFWSQGLNQYHGQFADELEGKGYHKTAQAMRMYRISNMYDTSSTMEPFGTFQERIIEDRRNLGKKDPERVPKFFPGDTERIDE